MHHNDYIDHDTIINYRKPSLSRSQKEKNSAPFPFNIIWRTFGCTLDGVLVLLKKAWNHDAISLKQACFAYVIQPWLVTSVRQCQGRSSVPL